MNIRGIYANARGSRATTPREKEKQELNNDLPRLSFTPPRDFRKKSRGGGERKRKEEEVDAEP